MAYYVLGSRVLAQGKRGRDVELLRDKLERIPLFPVLPVRRRDFFGADLTRAVQQLQRCFQLEADGVVGRETYRLFGLEVDEYWPSSLPPLGMRSVRQGMQGRDVRILQNRLGAFSGALAQMMARETPGTFGEGTRQALAAFQKETGLRATGVLNPEGCWMLDRRTDFGNRRLQYGRSGHDCGCDVFFLQERLREKGLLAKEATGFFDPETQAAVRELQKARGLPPDGIVQGKTFWLFGR